MQAGEVMTTHLVTVRPDATVREAAAMMDDLNVGALPVCDGRRLSASSLIATSPCAPRPMACSRTPRRCRR